MFFFQVHDTLVLISGHRFRVGLKLRRRFTLTQINPRNLPLRHSSLPLHSSITTVPRKIRRLLLPRKSRPSITPSFRQRVRLQPIPIITNTTGILIKAAAAETSFVGEYLVDRVAVNFIEGMVRVYVEGGRGDDDGDVVVGGVLGVHIFFSCFV